MKKKAQIQEVPGYVMLMLTILVLIVVFLVINRALQDTSESSFSTAVTSATVNGTNSLGVTHVFGVTVTNGTNNETVASTSYTLSKTTGTITFTEANANLTGGVNVSGTYKTNPTSYDSMADLGVAGSNLTSQMPTAGTIIGVMLIVFVVATAGFFGAKKMGYL